MSYIGKMSFMIGILVWSHISMAGAVSGGGGGTTNPNPTTIENIFATAIHESNILILGWLNKEEEFFNQKSTQEQLHSPYFKLFKSEKNIYDVLKETHLELRLTKPCFDSNGEAKDGSIYGTKIGSICLSPYSMAPKLNDYNENQETVALIIHELSHLVGADESEAERIQQDAIWDFNRLDFVDVIVGAQLLANGSLGGKIQEVMMDIDWWKSRPDLIKSSDLTIWIDKLQSLQAELAYNYKSIRYLREHKANLFNPMLTKVSALRDYVCSNDRREDRTTRGYCLDQLNLGFGDDQIVSAKTFISRQDKIDPKLLGPEYDEVLLHKVKDRTTFRGELEDMYKYLIEIQTDVRALNDFKIKTYKTE